MHVDIRLIHRRKLPINVKPRNATENVVVRKLIEVIRIRSIVTIIGKVASRMFLHEYVN